jgi:hypothetical protein
VTSIADSARRPAGLAWLRAVLLLGLLAALAAQTPLPWGWLWLIVPAAVALSLLLSWRFGAWGLTVPVELAAGVLAMGRGTTAWTWWIPTAALCGVWMGLREESQESGSGARAWRLLPLLVVAALLPRTVHYGAMVEHVEAQLKLGDEQLLQLGHEVGYTGERLAVLQRSVQDNATLRRVVLPSVLPTVLFLWSALLVLAGRSLSARTAGAMRWPALSRGRLREWRMPDGALWMLIAGLAIVVGPWAGWLATGWTLTLNAGVGFCVQGIAVLESWMLSRGVPASIIALTLLFVFAVAMPVFVVAAAAVGLSDAWLDFRHLEPAPSGAGEEK